MIENINFKTTPEQQINIMFAALLSGKNVLVKEQPDKEGNSEADHYLSFSNGMFFLEIRNEELTNPKTIITENEAKHLIYEKAWTCAVRKDFGQAKGYQIIFKE